MTSERLKELKELYAKSTQGKWHISKANRVCAPFNILDGHPDRDDYEAYISSHMVESDATFIAAVHNAMPEIIALIEAEQARQSAGNNESICAVCFHHAPFNITEPCMSECHGNSHFLSKTEQSRIVPDEEVQRAIDIYEKRLTMNGAYPDKPCHCAHCEADRLAIRALTTYIKPTPEEAADLGRAIAELEDALDIPDLYEPLRSAMFTSITALRRMAGEGK